MNLGSWLQGAATEAVGAALTSAVAGMVSEGLLPDVAYTAPHVRVPSAQQRNSLGSSVVLTSPCALPMAAAARRASGVTRPSLITWNVHFALLPRMGKLQIVWQTWPLENANQWAVSVCSCHGVLACR